VIYRIENGVETYEAKEDFEIVKEEGNIISYRLTSKLKEAGVFRYGYRIYPKNSLLPHRQDFAFTRWA
jgi:starch phosphorylase